MTPLSILPPHYDANQNVSGNPPWRLYKQEALEDHSSAFTLLVGVLPVITIYRIFWAWNSLFTHSKPMALMRIPSLLIESRTWQARILKSYAQFSLTVLISSGDGPWGG